LEILRVAQDDGFGEMTRNIEWIAHRGESFLSPENTMAAIDLAWRNGADAVEIDIHLTRDGQLILSHDFDTQRTCRQKLIIKDHTLAKLQQLDAGVWKGEQFRGEKMPTIDQALASIPDGKRMFVEIKVGPEAVPVFAQALKRSGKGDEQIVVISFKEETIRATREQLPNLQAFWLSGLNQDEPTKQWKPSLDELIARAKGCNAHGIDLQAREIIDADYTAKIREAGLDFYVWTIDEVPLATQMIAANVSGITTNRCAWLRAQFP
jgi:glycerophosphoryl diester phosphodiesterase